MRLVVLNSCFLYSLVIFSAGCRMKSESNTSTGHSEPASAPSLATPLPRTLAQMCSPGFVAPIAWRRVQARQQLRAGMEFQLPLNRRATDFLEGLVERLHRALALGEPVNVIHPDDEEVWEALLSLPSRVLLVSDNLSQVRSAVGLLEAWGIVGEFVGTGADAVNLLMETRFDLVMLDATPSLLHCLYATTTIRKFEHDCRARQPTVLVARMTRHLPNCESVLWGAGVNDVVRATTHTEALRESLVRWCAGEYCGAGHPVAAAPRRAA
jgi:CheY-like chemotaxis protein